MSMPANAIIFGIEPRLAIPMPAHAVQSMAIATCLRPCRAERRHALAEQVVGRAVVGLAAVAEAAGDRAEHHRRPDRHVTEGVEEVEPAVRLDVEDEIELGRRLVGQQAADLQAAGVEQHVDPLAGGADRRHRLAHRLAVAQVGGCTSGRCRRPR